MLKKMSTILAGAALTLTVSANVQAATITVEKGDTLWDLSQSHNTSVNHIKVLNDLKSDLIHPGEVLTIAPEKQYTVELGDTLWNIARDHQVTVAQIKDWNQLQTDLIHPGLTLLVFEGVKTAATDNKEQATTSTPKERTNTVQAVESPKESTNTAPAAKPQKEDTNSVPVAETQKGSTPTAPAAEKQTVKTPSAPSTTTKVEGVKEITVEATAYTASCEGCSGITATGINLLKNPNAKVISVDPSVIPLGSKVYVEGYGEAIAGDTGGAIKGNKIDVFIPNKQEALNFGRKQLKVTILH